MTESKAKPLRLLLGLDYGSKKIWVEVGEVITVGAPGSTPVVMRSRPTAGPNGRVEPSATSPRSSPTPVSPHSW